MGLDKAEIFRDIYDIIVVAGLSPNQENAVWRAVMRYALDSCVVDGLEGNAKRTFDMLMPLLTKEMRKAKERYIGRCQRMEAAREALAKKRAKTPKPMPKAFEESEEETRKNTAKQFVDNLLSKEAVRKQMLEMARITDSQLTKIANEIIADWRITKEDKVANNSDNRQHFIRLVKIKANSLSNGNNQRHNAQAVPVVGSQSNRHDDTDNILRRRRADT